MDSKASMSPSFVWAVWMDIYKSPYTLSTCSHSFCQDWLAKVK